MLLIFNYWPDILLYSYDQRITAGPHKQRLPPWCPQPRQSRAATEKTKEYFLSYNDNFTASSRHLDQSASSEHKKASQTADARGADDSSVYIAFNKKKRCKRRCSQAELCQYSSIIRRRPGRRAPASASACVFRRREGLLATLITARRRHPYFIAAAAASDNLGRAKLARGCAPPLSDWAIIGGVAWRTSATG